MKQLLIYESLVTIKSRVMSIVINTEQIMLPQIWKDVFESGLHYLNQQLTTQWEKRKQFLDYTQSLQKVLHATTVEIEEWNDWKSALIDMIMVSIMCHF